jgi:hypothetical protein
MREFEEVRKDEKAAEKSNDKVHLNLLDIQQPNQDLKLNKSNLLGEPESLAIPLNKYLTIRDAQEERQSYLRHGTTFLTRLGRHVVGADDAASRFDVARKDNDPAAMLALERADRAQRHFEHQVGSYSGAALKTALLFTGGKVGWAGLAAVSTADEAKPGDPFQQQMTDAALGAAKGLATRFVFNEINAQSWNPVIKGWTFGMSDRLIDVGLSRRTYLDANGDVDLKAGGLKTLSSVFSAPSLAVDAGTGAAAALALMPINAYTGGKFFSNEVAAKLTFAGVAGLTEGSLEELNKQQDNPKQPPIDWAEVAIKGLQKGAIDTVSALPTSGLIKLKK